MDIGYLRFFRRKENAEVYQQQQKLKNKITTVVGKNMCKKNKQSIRKLKRNVVGESLKTAVLHHQH